MGTSVLPESDDPLEAYRASKHRGVDPLSAYRAARDTGDTDPLSAYRQARAKVDTGDIDLRDGASSVVEPMRLSPVVVTKPGGLDELTRTPFADSLNQIAGRPNYGVTPDRMKGDTKMGAVRASGDSTLVTPFTLEHQNEQGDPAKSGFTPTKGQTSGEHVLAHEYAHHLASQAWQTPKENRTPFQQQIVDLTQTMEPDTFAEHFNAATQALRGNGADVSSLAPDAQKIARLLLTTPLYTKHPLNTRTPKAPGARALDPAAAVLQSSADYVRGELQRGGASLVQQAKDIKRDAELHGVTGAAMNLGRSLAQGIVNPVLTFGSLLGSPEDEMAGIPQSQRKTGLEAYNRETERLAQLAATNVRNNTPGSMQDQAAEEAAQAVRDKRKREAILSPIQTAANYIAPGIFGATERAATPIATSLLGKTAGKIAGRLAGEGAAGAAYNIASDPTHPISAGVTGAGAGVVLGETGHVAGRVTGLLAEGAGRASKKITSLLPPSEESSEAMTVERRAQPRPAPSELSPDQLAAYRERLVSEQQRLRAYAAAEPNPALAAAYDKRHARLGEEIKAIDAAAPPATGPSFSANIYPPGQVNIQRVPLRDINVDPARFQYKRGGDADTGAGSELKGLSKFDEQLAGVVSVWRDPSDGKLYAVNGHNRIALANRTGHESVNVQVLPARTAAEAKSMGALANIAEGRGTALDAAQFFRNSGLGLEDLRDRVSFKGQIAKQGMGLSKLAPDLFSKVETGQMPESHGAVLGEELSTPEMQRTAAQVIEASGKRLSEGEVREVARQVRSAGSESVTQDNLFGTENVEHPLYVEKAQLASNVLRRLSEDRRLFGYVAKEGRAAGLARAGNVIDVEQSRRIAGESAQLEEIFRGLYTRTGPIADALTEAARRVANGEKPRELVEKLYPAIRQAVQEALGRGEGAGNPAPGIRDQVGQSEAGRDATGRQAPGTQEEHALDSTDPGQGGLLTPADFETGALRAPRTLGESDSRVLGHPSETAPRAGPERLEVFAVQTSDGSVVEGKSLQHAWHEAKIAGLHSGDREPTFGFVTSQGRFIPEGREALTLAFRANQLRRNTTLYKALSNGIYPLSQGRHFAEGFPTYRNEDLVSGVSTQGGRAPRPPRPLLRGEIAGTVAEHGARIVSRAIRGGDEEGGHVTPIDNFSESGRYVRTEDGAETPVHAIEGYVLDNGDFITRDEASEMFPDADFGPEGRDPDSGPLFSPDDPFVLQGEDAGHQESLFAAREGTAASRPLSATERHARGEATRLRQILALETDPARRATAARQLAEHERLLNRDKPISREEMRTRAIAAEEESKPGTPPPGPDQGVLLSPVAQPTPLGTRFRKALGIKNSVTGDVVALRKISLGLADAIGVPVREGRGNLKRLKALGAYWKNEEIIRVRRLKAIDTVAHEIGHYLSKKYSLRMNAKLLPKAERAPVFRELVKMGRELYGSRAPAGGYAEEGVAQFFRFLVTDRQRMLNDAPHFTRYMDTVLGREPGLRDILNKAHDDWQRYQAAPAEAKLASMIEQELPSRLAGIRFEKLIDHWFNDLKPIRRAVEAIGLPGKMSENAANLAELTKGNAGRARDILDNGVIDFNTRQRTTRGLTQILKGIGEKNRDEFTHYIVAEQVLTKTAQGIDTGFDVKAAREIAEQGRRNPRFVEAAKEVWDFRSGLLNYMAGAGLMTPEEVALIRKGNPTPTPFYRSFDGVDDTLGSGRSAALAKNSAGIYRMKGSDRPILDPLQSIVHDAYTMVDRAQKHYAAMVLVKSALATEGGGHIAQLLPEVPVEARRIGIARVTDQLIDAGWTPPDDPALVAAMGHGVLEAFYEKSRPGAREMRDQVLPILLEGKRRWVQIQDKSTWEALEGMSVQGLGMYEQILTAPTRTLRMGATQANPDFAIINPLRDAFPAAIYSAGPTHLPGYHLLLGIGHVLKEHLGLGGGDMLTERWAQEGAENAGIVGADKRSMTKEYMRTVHEMTRDKQTALLDHLKHPFRSVREQFEIFENATRLGEFAEVRSERMKAGMPEIDASVEAAYSSRNVTQDFFKAGRTARIVNRYVPFFAAQLGDVYKLAQEFNPGNLRTPEGRARYSTVLARATAYITVPSISLYLLQKDDEDYQEIPEYYKANAWVIVDKENGPIPFTLQSGKKIRIWAIPRPYLLGYTFGYAPEKMLEAATRADPHAVRDLAKYAWSAFAPSFIPTIAGPLIENYANRSLYSGKSIVPSQTVGLEPSEQSQPYTGEAARILGRATNTSPAKIENVVRGYLGGAGQFAKGAADATVAGAERLAGRKPLSPPAAVRGGDRLDYSPVVGRFIISQPGANAESVQRVFDAFTRAEQKRQTWKAKLRSGDTLGASAYLEANKAEITSVASKLDAGSEGPLRELHKALGDITKARRDIAGSDMSPEAKAQKIDELGQLERKLARSYTHPSAATR